MTVTQVPNEPTRFQVESSSLECQDCHKLYSRREARNTALAKCPKCGGDLGVRFHMVDLANYRPIGECQCEHFQMRLRKELQKLSPLQLHDLTQGEAARLRCSHIEAARSFALDLTVGQHERERLRFARGRTEEAMP